MRKFRLIFEEVVPEGNCEGSVLRRYVQYPIAMFKSIPGFDEIELETTQHYALEAAFEDFKFKCLDKWDRVEHSDKYEGCTEEHTDDEG